MFSFSLSQCRYYFIVHDLKPDNMNNTTSSTNGEEPDITLGLGGIRVAQSLVLWTIVCLLVFFPILPLNIPCFVD